MPYCTNCGEEVTNEQRYCSYCGEQVGEDPRHGNTPGSQQPSQSRQQEPAKTHREQSHSAERSSPQASSESHHYPPGSAETVESIGRPGSWELFRSGLREIFSNPIALFGFFAAWFAVSVLVLFSPVVAVALFVGGSLIGLLAAGMTYVTTAAAGNDADTSSSAAISDTLSRFVTLLALWVLYVPAVVIGLLLFILPGLYVGGRLLLAFPACVLDKESATDSLSKSWRLTSGVSLRPIALFVFAFVVFFLLAILLSIPQSITMATLGVDLAEFETIDELMELMEDPAFVLINSFYQAIALAIPTGALQIAATKMYLDERDREEDEWRYQ